MPDFDRLVEEARVRNADGQLGQNANPEARVPLVNGNRRVRRRREHVVRPYSRDAFSLIVSILRENVTLINSNCSRLFRIVNLMNSAYSRKMIFHLKQLRMFSSLSLLNRMRAN